MRNIATICQPIMTVPSDPARSSSSILLRLDLPSRSTLYRGDNDYSTNSDSQDLAQRGAPKVSPQRSTAQSSFPTNPRKSSWRAGRDVGSYIGPEARSAFCLCAERNASDFCAPRPKRCYFEYPEAAYNAPEGVTANMSPRLAFVNI